MYIADVFTNIPKRRKPMPLRGDVLALYGSRRAYRDAYRRRLREAYEALRCANRGCAWSPAAEDIISALARVRVAIEKTSRLSWGR